MEVTLEAKATTFDADGEEIEVTILSPPNAVGLCRLNHNGKRIVRHKDRLDPINPEAKQLLGK